MFFVNSLGGAGIAGGPRVQRGVDPDPAQAQHDRHLTRQDAPAQRDPGAISAPI